ncbi:winged helix-turn-helix transcriptional regulator [Streptomyces sp. ventii]|uniref:Winged helix-turn-helix transcriptional regulator n=2 Tax=Streptomyces spiramenti TaxID=2720606 RepID=A0ABX1AS27_9ACTN|nr:metalloregulator ArsR/SmtB family transcription factor [Streptomyces spiramenti]NJP67217.1 winged helix-turn-helix transcriptional regulator [Streptomyces spiramenti]
MPNPSAGVTGTAPPTDRRPPTDGAELDRAFAALADPVRRAIVARLSTGPATVLELAGPFDISTQAVSRHIQVLARAGLVTRSQEAQRRPVHLAPEALEGLTSWIDRYRLAHEARYRRLDAALHTPGPRSGHGPTHEGAQP